MNYLCILKTQIFQKIPNKERNQIRSESDTANWHGPLLVRGAGLNDRNTTLMFAALSVENILLRGSKYVNVKYLVVPLCCHFLAPPADRKFGARCRFRKKKGSKTKSNTCDGAAVCVFVCL